MDDPVAIDEHERRSAEEGIDDEGNSENGRPPVSEPECEDSQHDLADGDEGAPGEVEGAVTEQQQQGEVEGEEKEDEPIKETTTPAQKNDDDVSGAPRLCVPAGIDPDHPSLHLSPEQLHLIASQKVMHFLRLRRFLAETELKRFQLRVDLHYAIFTDLALSTLRAIFYRRVALKLYYSFRGKFHLLLVRAQELQRQEVVDRCKLERKFLEHRRLMLETSVTMREASERAIIARQCHRSTRQLSRVIRDAAERLRVWSALGYVPLVERDPDDEPIDLDTMVHGEPSPSASPPASLHLKVANLYDGLVAMAATVGGKPGEVTRTTTQMGFRLLLSALSDRMKNVLPPPQRKARPPPQERSTQRERVAVVSFDEEERDADEEGAIRMRGELAEQLLVSEASGRRLLEVREEGSRQELWLHGMKMRSAILSQMKPNQLPVLRNDSAARSSQASYSSLRQRPSRVVKQKSSGKQLTPEASYNTNGKPLDGRFALDALRSRLLGAPPNEGDRDPWQT